ncbi:MAG: hypothetical protein ACR2JY_04385 [Chloroflexota bacterium]
MGATSKVWQERCLIDDVAEQFAEQRVAEDPTVESGYAEVRTLLAELEAGGTDHRAVGRLEDAVANLVNAAVHVAALVGRATGTAFDPDEAYRRVVREMPVPLAQAGQRTK